MNVFLLCDLFCDLQLDKYLIIQTFSIIRVFSTIGTFSIIGDIGMLLGMEIGIANLTKLTKFSFTCFFFPHVLNMLMYLNFNNIGIR